MMIHVQRWNGCSIEKNDRISIINSILMYQGIVNIPFGTILPDTDTYSVLTLKRLYKNTYRVRTFPSKQRILPAVWVETRWRRLCGHLMRHNSWAPKHQTSSGKTIPKTVKWYGIL